MKCNTKEKHFIYCTKCHFEFSYDQVKVKQSNVNMGNNDQMILTYFQCPFCKEIYKISIEDGVLLSLRKSIKEIENKVSMFKRFGTLSQFRASQLTKVKNEYLERYKEYFEKINDRYKGFFTFSEDGKEIIYHEN